MFSLNDKNGPSESLDSKNKEEKMDSPSIPPLSPLLEPLTYYLSIKGRGVRPLMGKFMGELFHTPPLYIDYINTLCERIHTCSLLVDDFQDDSTQRRGETCAHLLYGSNMTINSAYLEIFNLLNNLHYLHIQNKSSLIQSSISLLKEMHIGQGYDIQWKRNHFIPSVDEYRYMVKGKTTALFMIALHAFYIIHKDPSALTHTTLSYDQAHSIPIPIPRPSLTVPLPDQSISLNQPSGSILEDSIIDKDNNNDSSKKPMDKEFEGIEKFNHLSKDIEYLGAAFQIMDDLINLSDKDYWKKKGFCEDLRNRNCNFVVVYYIQNHLVGSEYQNDKQTFLNIWNDPSNNQLNEDNVLLLFEILDRSKVFSEVKLYLETLLNQVHYKQLTQIIFKK